MTVFDRALDDLARHHIQTSTASWRARTGDQCHRCAPHAWHGVRCVVAGCDCPTSFKEEK